MRPVHRFAMQVASCTLVLTLGPCTVTPAQEPEVPPDTRITLQLIPTSYVIGAGRYTVTIDAGGFVIYQGEGGVRVSGRQTARVPVSVVATLLAEAERIGFFELQDHYSAPITHMDTTIVTISTRGRTKRVENYFSAPESLHQLQTAIYDAAGVDRWVFLDEQSLDELVRSGWSASTDMGAIWLTEAVRRDKVAVARRLIGLGADLRGWVRQRIPPLLLAQSGGMVDVLIKAGANPHEERGQMGPIGTPLMVAATKNASVAEALLRAGARLEDTDSNGHTALWYAACAGSPDVVRILLAAGANPRGSVSSSTALDCARNKRQDPDNELRWHRMFNHGRPTDAAFDEVAGMLIEAEQRRRP